MIKVVIIGSGNVAFHLIGKMQESAAIHLLQVLVRDEKSLAGILPENKIITQYHLLEEADIYIISVTDNAIPEVSNGLPFSNRLVVHTSGTTAIDAIASKNRRGVFYPLQTFSKNKAVNFTTIPFCLEAENEMDYVLMETVLKSISEKVYRINSFQRKSLHVAAVFVCNFVNHLYHIGSELCKENDVPFEILYPLIEETAKKIHDLSPLEAQTGPAKREDTKTVNSHLDFLKNDEYKNLYQILTQSIQNVKKL